MKISKIYLENFRGYQNKTIINFDNLTTLIGRNDAGKSTILEALEIFFNGKKIEKSDICLHGDSETAIIGVVFKDYPQNIILDSTVTTSLHDEYLLNKDGELEILKKYTASKTETYLVANYPTDPLVEGLHQKKQKQLQDLLRQNQLTVSDLKISSQMRKKIFSSLTNPVFEEQLIPTDKEDSKKIWSKIQEYLPLYELFQADRKNVDQDEEIQNPMKLLIKELIQDATIKEQLNSVLKEVISKSEDLAQLTLEKLKEINSEMASELNPKFNEPSWENVFKFSLDSDLGVPLNKRGSGVRRLILLSFFRAEAERRKNSRNVPNIIYAIEEPETALHPNQQKMLIEAFLDLAVVDINQIIITTHSPAIAKQLPTNSLRLIDKDETKNTVVYDNKNKQDILFDIMNCLGVFPDFNLTNINKVKLAICVEGKNDIEFLKILNNNISEFKEIIDLTDDRIVFIPMGGSSLQFWVNNNYLEKLNLAQLHIYDSDKGSDRPNKYIEYIEIINRRQYSKAFETNLRELENYITPSLLISQYPEIEDVISTLEWDTLDVAELLAKYTHENDPQSKHSWDNLPQDKKGKKKSGAKNKINNEIIKNINSEYLKKYGYYSEISEWFIQAQQLLNSK